MNDHKPFLDNIYQNPADEGPRLVYADWLEERGDPRGEYIRLAIDFEKFGEPSKELPFKVSKKERIAHNKWQVARSISLVQDLRVGDRVDFHAKGYRYVHQAVVESIVLHGEDNVTHPTLTLTDVGLGPFPHERYNEIWKTLGRLLRTHIREWISIGVQTRAIVKHVVNNGIGDGPGPGVHLLGIQFADTTGFASVMFGIEFRAGFPEKIGAPSIISYDPFYEQLLQCMPLREVSFAERPMIVPIAGTFDVQGVTLGDDNRDTLNYRLIDVRAPHSRIHPVEELRQIPTPYNKNKEATEFDVTAALLGVEYPGADPTNPIQYVIPRQIEPVRVDSPTRTVGIQWGQGDDWSPENTMVERITVDRRLRDAQDAIDFARFAHPRRPWPAMIQQTAERLPNENWQVTRVYQRPRGDGQ